MDSLINIGINLTYLMIAFAALAAVGFGIKNMIQNTNNAKKTLCTAGGLVVIFVIAYLLASDAILESYKKHEITASTARQVGMGLITCYILTIGAISAILYAELLKEPLLKVYSFLLSKRSSK